MKIVICASVYFSKEIVDTAQQLKSLGHKVILPENVEEYAAREDIPKTQHELAEKKIAGDLIKDYYYKIVDADCILVLNFSKKNIKNYVGGNTFLEMGFAHVQNIPIYLLNPIPEITYRDELLAMKPIVINGDLSKIK